jgi:hypothetical protein
MLWIGWFSKNCKLFKGGQVHGISLGVWINCLAQCNLIWPRQGVLAGKL